MFASEIVAYKNGHIVQSTFFTVLLSPKNHEILHFFRFYSIQYTGFFVARKSSHSKNGKHKRLITLALTLTHKNSNLRIYKNKNAHGKQEVSEYK